MSKETILTWTQAIISIGVMGGLIAAMLLQIPIPDGYKYIVGAVGAFLFREGLQVVASMIKK